MKLITIGLVISTVASSCIHKNLENSLKNLHFNHHHAFNISYQVAIFASDKPNLILCAGALISKSHILAPASCVDTHYGIVAVFSWPNPGTKLIRHIGPEDIEFYPTWPKYRHRNIPEIYKSGRKSGNRHFDDSIQNDDELRQDKDESNFSYGWGQENLANAGKKVKDYYDYERSLNGETNCGCDCDYQDWKKNQFVDNIAILVLQNPVECKENLQPISLPYLHRSSNEFNNLNIFATGWTNNFAFYPALPYINLQAVARCDKIQLPNRACFYSIEDDKPDLDKTGGILVANSWEDDKLILIGLSERIDPFETSQVFIKVAPYVNWIRTKINIEFPTT